MCKLRVEMRLPLLICLFASVSLTAGCDSGGDDDDNGGNVTGTFEVDISGEGIDESFSGIAVFGEGEDSETGEDAFVIVMPSSQANTTANAVYLVIATSRPGTGTYDIVSTEGELGDAFQAIAYSDNVLFAGTDGTVTITTSTSARVAGTYSFSALNLVNQAEVTVEGSFNAVTGAVGIPF